MNSSSIVRSVCAGLRHEKSRKGRRACHCGGADLSYLPRPLRAAFANKRRLIFPRPAVSQDPEKDLFRLFFVLGMDDIENRKLRKVLIGVLEILTPGAIDLQDRSSGFGRPGSYRLSIHRSSDTSALRAACHMHPEDGEKA